MAPRVKIQLLVYFSWRQITLWVQNEYYGERLVTKFLGLRKEISELRVIIRSLSRSFCRLLSYKLIQNSLKCSCFIIEPGCNFKISHHILVTQLSIGCILRIFPFVSLLLLHETTLELIPEYSLIMKNFSLLTVN